MVKVIVKKLYKSGGSTLFLIPLMFMQMLNWKPDILVEVKPVNDFTGLLITKYEPEREKMKEIQIATDESEVEPECA